MGGFWYIVVPGVIFGVIYYGYNSGGFLAEWTQRIFDPLIKLGAAILNFIFGI